ncbi:MAG TPA: tRNA pseudouridine(55) synthase TruB [Burkholderiales bacterium]|nr:tRNA pseudouridine(55) synthase TruB [Burkholderiales bacterium]
MSDVRTGRRIVDGVLLLDKPSGITSHTAMQKVRRLFNAAKAGHTGTLDPLATGLLPVCLGEATKFSHLLLEADKTYLAVIRLDLTTRTGDLDGEVTASFPVINVKRERVDEVLRDFAGETHQTPPMYSAIKHAGQPLYKLARAGRDIPRHPRKIFISSMIMVDMHGNELTVRVCCSKGTYVRVLAEDIGRKLGCGGCLAALRREVVGEFALTSGAVTLEQLEALTPAQRGELLMPPDALVKSLPRLDLDAGDTRRLSHGQTVERTAASAEGLARIYGPDREFLGIAEITGPGRIIPRRLTARG